MFIKKDNGVTLMNLVVVIVVMIVLVSVAGYYSIDSVRNSYKANEEKELMDIVNYVAIKKNHCYNKN